MEPIRLLSFEGVAPAITPRNLPSTMGQQAANHRMRGGSLSALRGHLFVNTPTKVGLKKSIYRINYLGIDYWLHWTTNVHMVKSPIAKDAFDRYYYTDDSEPRVTTPALATTSGTNYPIAFYTLGVPAPTNTPALAVVGGSGANDTRTYGVTYVTPWGEEGSMSPTVTVTGFQNGSWNLSGLNAVMPAGTYQTFSKNIYRTVTGTNGVASFMLVATIAIGTATYSDTALDASLAIVLPSLTWVPPPTTLSGLVSFPGGIMAGFSGNTLYFSEPFRPHAWPIQYQQSLEFPIVGLGVSGSTLVVCTSGNPYLVTGVHPSAMNIQKSNLIEPCISATSIIDVGNGIKYASNNGLVHIGIGINSVSTEGVITPQQWRANYFPSTLIGAFYENRYHGNYTSGASNGVTNGGGFALPDDLSRGFNQFNDYCSCMWVDPATGLMYVVVLGDIRQWDADPNTSLQYDWISKEFVTLKPGNLGAMKVDADFSAFTAPNVTQATAALAFNTALIASGKNKGAFGSVYPGQVPLGGSNLRNVASYIVPNLTVSLYADGVLRFSKTITSAAPFRLPSGYKSDTVRIRISGNVEVFSVKMAETMHVLERL